MSAELKLNLDGGMLTEVGILADQGLTARDLLPLVKEKLAHSPDGFDPNRREAIKAMVRQDDLDALVAWLGPDLVTDWWIHEQQNREIRNEVIRTTRVARSDAGVIHWVPTAREKANWVIS